MLVTLGALLAGCGGDDAAPADDPAESTVSDTDGADDLEEEIA